MTLTRDLTLKQNSHFKEDPVKALDFLRCAIVSLLFSLVAL